MIMTSGLLNRKFRLVYILQMLTRDYAWPQLFFFVSGGVPLIFKKNPYFLISYIFKRMCKLLNRSIYL